MNTAALILGGLVLLVLGGEVLVRGASSLALSIGLSPLVVGLTVVAFATSAPELAVTLNAVTSGSPELAIGNVVGSNIANVLLVLGVAALMGTIVVKSRVVKRDIPVMIGMSILLFVVAYSGNVGKLEGAILLACLVAYVIRAVVSSRRYSAGPKPGEGRDAGGDSDAYLGEIVGEPPRPHAPAPAEPGSFAAENAAESPPAVVAAAPHLEEAPEKPLNPLLAVLAVAAGVAMLVFGAQLLVNGAKEIATGLGVSELVIGLTVVALGTSLPELATVVIAVRRGERDLAVGNAVGSNIFNIGAVIGLSAIVVPDGIPIPPSAINLDIPLVVLTAFLLLPIAITGSRIGRVEGALLLGSYLAYTGYLLLASSDHDALGPYSFVMMWIVIPLVVIILMVQWYGDWSERRKRKGQAAEAATPSGGGQG